MSLSRRKEKDMKKQYKAFDGFAIEIYVDGELTATHYEGTFAEAHNYAKTIERLSRSSETQKAEMKFYTCDENGNLIDQI